MTTDATIKRPERRAGVWTVGEVAALTGVSVRALHHYDELGLLSPQARSEAGYRQYTAPDLARLHRILTYRELGFGLADIARLLEAAPGAEVGALRIQAALLRERLQRTQAHLTQIEQFLAAAERGEGVLLMSDERIKQMFGGFDPAQYEAEVQQRWGETAAYRQSRARTSRYTAADWQQVRAEMGAITARYLALLEAGTDPTASEAQAVAAEHHAHISRRYYDAPPAMMRGLAQMWVQDERFTRNIDTARAGLAAYQSAAVTAWADAQG